MSLINNRNEESLPEFEVISGGKEDIRSSFADRTEEETEIDFDKVIITSLYFNRRLSNGRKSITELLSVSYDGLDSCCVLFHFD